MFCYRAYGLNIQSELRLPELPSGSDGPPDLVIRHRPINVSGLAGLDGGARLLGRVAGIGRFFFDHGRELVVDSLPGVPEDRLRPTILGPILAIVLRQRGLNMLHASCAAVHGNAVVFIGPCGAGKSTMAQAFCGAGHTIVTDDLVAVFRQGGQHFVLPGYPQVKLNTDSALALLGDAEQLRPLFAGATKRVYQGEQSVPATALPLRKIYLLKMSDRLIAEPLSLKGGLAVLMEHSRGIPPLTHPDYKKAQFEQCARVAQDVPISTLGRRRALQELPDVVRFVEDDLEAELSRVAA